jgi:hypothetical protein
MASTHVYDTLKARIAADFAPQRVIDLDEIDVALEQGTDAFFVLAEVRQEEELIGFGNTELCQRERGVLRVSCMVPAPESSAIARAQADSVRAALRHLRESDIRVIETDPPEPDTLNSGLWTSYGTDILYEYDFHVPAL